LWLPPNYRPDQDDAFFKNYDIQDNIVVLGHKSGHVTIVKFDPEAEGGVDVDARGRRKGIDDDE
jgi:hypothetical protein